MAKVTLNAKQFNQLVSGNMVFIGDCELSLGELGFEVIQVHPPTEDDLDEVEPRKIHLVKRRG